MTSARWRRQFFINLNKPREGTRLGKKRSGNLEPSLAVGCPLGLVSPRSIARPFTANAAATHCDSAVDPGFAQKEDVAYKRLVVDDETGGNL